MSGMDHQATVDRGLRMKIKRTKNMGPTSNKSDTKHEIVKSSDKSNSNSSSSGASSSSASGSVEGGSGANGSALDKTKQTTMTDKDKSPKVKSSHKKERFSNKGDKVGGKPGDGGPTVLSSVSTSLDVPFSQVSLEPKQAEVAHGKKENLVSDPYEFNAKVEDGLGFPVKKIKTEKVDTATSTQHTSSVPATNQHVGTSTETVSVGVSTDAECLGPCEPGTSVTLEGIVWHETENGVLVVNVTWRDKTYVGTLLDATRHDWAPPRFNCESPVSEFETRTPKGRAKRGGRATSSTPVDQKGPEGRKLRKGRKGSNTFQAPPSPAKSDISSSSGLKRKGRPTEIDLSSTAGSKRCRSQSQSQSTTPGTESPVSSLIECPEPNCGKKYKHMNGLRYHQTHAHQSPGPVVTDGEEDTRDTCENAEDSVMDDFDSSVADPCETNDSAIKTSGKRNSEIVNNDEEEDEEEEEESSTNNKKDTEDVAKSDQESNNEVVDVGTSSEQNTKTSDLPAKPDSVQVDKKEVNVATSSVASSSIKAKPLVSIPSGNAFQIVSSQHVAPTTFGSIGLLSQAALTAGVVQTCQAVPLTASVVTASPIQSAIPITVTAISASPTIQPLDLKTESLSSSKTEKPIRPRISHPIIPQIVALSTTVSVTHTNMNPVTTPSTQMTSTLKPIQPKPLAPGELPPVNPAIFKDLKERKVKPKKRDKTKDKETTSTISSSGPISSTSSTFSSPRTGKVEPLKTEQTGVIKVAPIVPKPVEQQSKPEPLVVCASRPALERPDKPLSVTAPSSNVGVVTAQVQPSPKGMDLSQTTRQTDPPSILKVCSSLSALDNKSSVNDNVQSPSYYSDISEESGSPATQMPSDSPTKNKEDPGLAGAKQRESSGNNTGLPGPQSVTGGMDGQSAMPSYNMYGSYYGQAPYMLPTNLSSPSSTGSAQQQQQQQQHQQQQQQQQQAQQKSHSTNKDRNTPSEPAKSGPSEPKMKREDSKDSDAGKDDKGASGGDKGEGGHRPLTQQEYQHLQHQKWLQQQMYSLPPHAQYRVMAAYAPYLESSFHMHMMSNDPHYRHNYERGMEEEKRTGNSDSAKKDSDSAKISSNVGRPQGLDPLHGAGEGTRLPASGLDSIQGHKDIEHKRSGDSFSERDMKEKNTRDKQNENHQILKENIDLKEQMDKNRYDRNRFDPYSGSREKNNSEEQARRMQMYHQQTLIRHQKREEHQKKMEGGAKFESHRPSTDVGGKSSAGSVVHSASSSDSKSRDHSTSDSGKLLRMDIKREPDSGKPSTSDNNDSKVTVEDKLKSSSSSLSNSDRMRVMEMPKSKQTSSSKVSSPHTPTSIPSSAAQAQLAASGSPYNAYMYQNQYMQPNSYGQIPFDHNHPMYRGLNPAMMYAGAYLHHPSQLPYRVGMEMEEKDKMGLPPKLPSDSESKVSDVPHGPSFQGSGTGSAGGHKIHELQEKSRASPHRSSPAPSKNEVTPTTPGPHLLGGVEKGREFCSSPPTQRHVHTHHHTHVVEAAYPVYSYPTDHYSTGIFTGASQQKTPPAAAILPQPGHSQFPPK